MHTTKLDNNITVIDDNDVITGPDGAVAMSSANELVGTGFASLYRLQSRAVFFLKAQLTSNLVTTNYKPTVLDSPAHDRCVLDTNLSTTSHQPLANL